MASSFLFLCFLDASYMEWVYKWFLQVGKTKVFLRAGQMAGLDTRRAEKLNNAAKTIQRKIRTHIARKQFIALRKATICIQSIWRGVSANL